MQKNEQQFVKNLAIKKKEGCLYTWKASWIKTDFLNTVGPCLVRFCVVRIWIVQVLKNTPDLHSAYYGFLAFSDPLYYSGTCVVWFYIVWFCIVRTFFWILRSHYARTCCTTIGKLKVYTWWNALLKCWKYNYAIFWKTKTQVLVYLIFFIIWNLYFPLNECPRPGYVEIDNGIHCN